MACGGPPKVMKARRLAAMESITWAAPSGKAEGRTEIEGRSRDNDPGQSGTSGCLAVLGAVAENPSRGADR
jgi:hypothetical protein